MDGFGLWGTGSGPPNDGPGGRNGTGLIENRLLGTGLLGLLGIGLLGVMGTGLLETGLAGLLGAGLIGTDLLWNSVRGVGPLGNGWNDIGLPGRRLLRHGRGLSWGVGARPGLLSRWGIGLGPAEVGAAVAAEIVVIRNARAAVGA